MQFKATSDEKRKLDLDWERVNIYISRYKPGTSFDVEITRRQVTRKDPMKIDYFARIVPPFMKALGYEKHETLIFHRQLKIRYYEHDPEHEVYKDKRGIWRNVPHVFREESKMPVSKRQEFVDWVLRRAAFENVYIADYKPKK